MPHRDGQTDGQDHNYRACRGLHVLVSMGKLAVQLHVCVIQEFAGINN